MGVNFTVFPAESAASISAAIVRYVSVIAILPCLAGCAGGDGPSGLKDESLSFSPRVVQLGEPVPKGGGVVKVGAPYNVAGQIYTPREDPTYDKTGIASWYGVLFHGRRTSNGEVYDMNALTGAHPTLPLPSYARVTNLENNRTIVVRINDRGPYKPNRIIDLSDRAAELLDFKSKGTARVRVQYVGPAPLSGDDHFERMVLAQQPWAAHLEPGAGAGTKVAAVAASQPALANQSTPPQPTFKTASLMPPLAAPSQQQMSRQPEARPAPQNREAGLAGKVETASLVPPSTTPRQPDTRQAQVLQNWSAGQGQVGRRDTASLMQPLAAPGQLPPPHQPEPWQPPQAWQTPQPQNRGAGQPLFAVAGAASGWQAPQNRGAGQGQAGKGDLAVVKRSNVFVQAGLFRDPRNAETLRQRIASLGPVEIAQISLGGNILHRVSIGPFADESQARLVLDHVNAAGIRDAKIIAGD